MATAPFDYRPTILAQYANSPTITALIAAYSAWLDPAADLDAFYDTVWNVDTAVGFGLDIWGRIVGVDRVVPIDNTDYFGFEEAAAEPFNQAPFFSGTKFTTSFALSDDAYRTLILAKAASNITDGSIPSINQILLSVFAGRGRCYVVDNLDMTMTFKFEFALTPLDLNIIANTTVLPQPCCVTILVDHP